ncbi:MAG: hypothetical protein OEN01_03710 [Candidatus Krumholzibacteria bacterium]|nr:hypothetical protein [Candidatus Krumholzibacteria bacterium]
MIGDRVLPKPHHTKAAREIFKILQGPAPGERPILTIAGESGGGKSEIASELSRFYGDAGCDVFVFQQDDYFYYPPKTNDGIRKKDINHVGTGEVDLALLDEHLKVFRRSSATAINKPLVIFEEDRITEESIAPNDYGVAIAEGTYTTLLQNVDYRVFIDRTYEDTRDDRIARRRERIDDFSEKILRIEHEIITAHKPLADFIVSKEFTVTLTEGGKRRV